ncbi:DUF4157 domain-containing protein [Tundrisphaera lichenicola]|uniref:eCIS core domain-containing protein n=1 Tax=Tundrisphaera lichenicola TaxID=2029860 RepID=UPI003EBEA253
MTTKVTPVPTLTAVKPGTVLRKCSCEGSCERCAEADREKAVVRRQAASPSAASGVLSPPVAKQIQAATQSGGRPLPPGARAAFEPRFGRRDFSGVRIHDDASADKLSRQIGAQAFTVGQHVFFSSGRFDPDSSSGQKLLAHELTHVAQQGDAPVAVQASLELGAPDTAAEREADRVAHAVAEGRDAGPVSRLSAGVVQRAVVELPASEPLLVLGQKASDATDHSFLVNVYKTLGRQKALRTTHAGRTLDLWPVWERSRAGMTNSAGQTAEQVRAAMQSQCSPDHIVELQIGGSDDPGNLRLLSRGRNQQAGASLAGQITRVANAQFGGRPTNTDILVFTDAARGGDAPSPDPCLSADPLRYPMGRVATGAGSRDQAFSKKLEYKAGGVDRVTGYGTPTEAAPPYTINPDQRLAVPGLELRRVSAVSGPKDATLRANLSDRVRRMPLKNRTFPEFDLAVVGGVLNFGAAPVPIGISLGFLSEALLTPKFEAGKLSASGILRPSLPILRAAEVQMEIRDEALSARASIPPAKIREALPIPGLVVDQCDLTIGAADGEFTAAGGFAFRYGSLARGRITATLNNRAGFSASGVVDLQIPGLDQASGEAWIRQGRLGGRIAVGKDKFKFPGVTSARAVIEVSDGKLDGTGSVVLAIPGLRAATLDFSANSLGQYSLGGTARGTIPGLRDPSLTVAYANGDLSGTGSAGFAIPGFEGGNVNLRYARGLFSGDASLDYRKGRLSGRVFGRLSPQAKLSGGGELSYQIVPGLIATVMLEVRENGTARIAGELRLPDPIILFPEFAYNKRLFGLSLDIPIFGISFGSRSVGIIANLSASLNARAGIGPGQIRKPRIMAAFDPSAEASPASFQASGELYVPASAEVSLVLAGGIGVSLLIVKALGGIQATAAAGLFGALSVPVDLRYVGGKFTAMGAAELFAQPRLRFQLDAFARVEADLFVTTVELYSKTWKLAAFEWGGDFKIGLRFPVAYTFGEPFRLSLDQLEFIAPQVDVRKAVRDLITK